MKTLSPFYTILFLLLPSLAAQAQCDQPPTLGNDTTICDGTVLLLTPGPGFVSYLWNDGSPAIYQSVFETGHYTCEVHTGITLDDVVVNGDFTDGNIGFTSDYAIGTGGSWGQLSLEGTFAVASSAADTHDNFAPCTDPNAPGGNILVVNGAADPGVNIWCQTVAVTPGTDYAFSAWLTSVTPANPAVLQFTINGVLLGTPFGATSTTCDWQQFYTTWNAGASTTADICITNQNTSEDGNDFALDAISFSPFCTYLVDIDVTVVDPPQVELGTDTALCPGQQLLLTAEGSGAADLLWQDGSTASTFTALEDGTYWVRASVANCMTSDTIRILPSECGVDVRIPNVFTPNGDGPNALFTPIAMTGVERLSLSVYNRWGQEMFSSSSPNFGWNGRSPSGGNVPDGVYYWVLNYDPVNAEPEEKHGVVTLMR